MERFYSSKHSILGIDFGEGESINFDGDGFLVLSVKKDQVEGLQLLEDINQNITLDDTQLHLHQFSIKILVSSNR